MPGLSILVLVVPGLFAIHPANYRPFLTHGLKGLAASLVPLLSVLAMGGLIVVQALHDIQTLSSTTLGERIGKHSLTSLELFVAWTAIGAVLYLLARRRRSSQ